MANPFSSSSSSPPPIAGRWWNHDVFISFRGEDTRRNFTDHLYYALTDAGINAYRDDINLRRGDDIASELIRAIRESRICVVVFSDHYADSRWCLEELAEIVECRKTMNQLLLPVFYGVDPSDVRKQTNSFAAAFEKHEQRFGSDMERLVKWRAALMEAGNLSGWDLRNFADGHEAKFIKKIVEQILNELKITYIEVATYPVGIEIRMKKLISLMNVETEKETQMVGICGMSGIGKTTLSKALFNQYFNRFESKSFLANVRENSSSPNGLIRLQEQLLSDILKTNKMRISNVDRGIINIKQRLCQKKVLIVLDDVDHIDQVNALARQRDWFGFGSRMVITTRNKQLLKALKVEEIYMVENEPLDEHESLELFSWHTFHEPYPPQEFLEYSKIVVSYCGSLPLALEVLGSSVLCGRGITEWKAAIEKLKRIPHGDIQKKLRLSYDALNDDTEKDIFLDVSCFLVGMDKELVVKILDGCGFYGGIGLGVLISRCLVKVDIIYNKLTMHDLLRDMGREIVRENYPKEPGKRSRLWHQEEVYKVLSNNTGTENIEGLALELPRANKEELNAEAFGKMQNLRLLKLNYGHLIGNFEHLISKELRWICWHGFPLKSIPSNFYQGNLVVIDMRHSSLTEAWSDDSKCLGNLKVLNLSHSHKLKKSPNFSKLPNLEELKLKNCTSLSELHQSIGQLGNLYSIKMQGCINLKNLPINIYKLKSLQTLNIVGCSKIDKLHEDLGELESLTTLLVDQTSIRQIPYSIVRLNKLKDLSFYGCKRNSSPSRFLSRVIPSFMNTKSLSLLPNSFQGLTSLTALNLGNCNLDAIPEDFGNLSSLEELNLQGNNFKFLGDKFSGLSKLRDLSLDNCERLEIIKEFPRNLSHFSAVNCKSLERTPDISSYRRAPALILTNCDKLEEVCGLDKLDCETNVRMAGCSNLSSQFKMNLIKKWSGGGFASICLPGNEIPESFDFITSNPPLSFQIPNLDHQNHKLVGLTVSVIYSFNSKSDSWYESPSIKLINKTKNRSNGYVITGRHGASTIHGIHTWMIHLPFSYGYVLDSQDHVELQISTKNNNLVVQKCGVKLVYFEEEIEKNSALPEIRPAAAAAAAAVEVCRSGWKFNERGRGFSRVNYFISVMVLILSVIMISWFSGFSNN